MKSDLQLTEPPTTEVEDCSIKLEYFYKILLYQERKITYFHNKKESH